MCIGLTPHQRRHILLFPDPAGIIRHASTLHNLRTMRKRRTDFLVYVYVCVFFLLFTDPASIIGAAALHNLHRRRDGFQRIYICV